MTTIDRRPLGRSGVSIAPLGLGGVFIRRGAAEHDEALRVVHRALELGVDYFDTAPAYGNSQQVLGEALAGRREPHLVGTKCGRWQRPEPFRDLDAYQQQFEQTLRDLRRDRVDILYLHEADWAAYWSDGPAAARHLAADAPLDGDAPVLRFMRWAHEQGLARALGISGNNADLLARVLQADLLPIDAVLVAFQYDLIWRNARRALLPAARARGVAVILGAPLHQGRLVAPRPEWLETPPPWLTPPLRERFAALYQLAAETAIPLPELALRYLLAEQAVTAVIPGAADVTQLEANHASLLRGPLPPAIHARIEALGHEASGLKDVDY